MPASFKTAVGAKHRSLWPAAFHSDVPARLGLKAPALARLKPALAFSKTEPSQSRHSRLGPGPARLKPRLLVYFLTCIKLLLILLNSTTLCNNVNNLVK